MTRRNKIIIIVAVIVAVLGLALLAIAPILRRPASGPANQNTPIGANTNGNLALPSSSGNAQATPPPVFTKEASTQSTLLAIALTFTERFGSFSTEADFKNLEDLKILMTEDMIVWAERFVADNQNQNQGEFYGVTTRALRADVVSISADETQAQVAVSTQQEESRGSVSSRTNIIYKKLLLNFRKIGESWRVDSADWQ